MFAAPVKRGFSMQRRHRSQGVLRPRWHEAWMAGTLGIFQKIPRIPRRRETQSSSNLLSSVF